MSIDTNLITTKHEVTAVTVFPDRARVTCRAKCQVEADTQWILFAGLPQSLEPASLRLTEQSGTAELRLRSLDATLRPHAQTPDADVRALEEALEALQDQLRALEDEKAVLEAEAAQLRGLRQPTDQYARGIAFNRFKIDDLEALLETLRESDRRIRTAQQDLARRQRQLERELEQKQEELNRWRAASSRKRYEARVQVDVTQAGEVLLGLTYVVKDARWRPLYDLNLENGRLHLTAYAEITQRTSQNWNQVGVRVSTAQPELTQRVPDLAPWYVDVVQPRPVQGERAMHATAAVHDAVERPRHAFAAQQEDGATVTFEADGRHTISSDGSPHRIALQESELDAELDYTTVPKHTPAVYRRVKTTLENVPLLAGHVNLFMEQAFIGSREIEYTPARGKLELLMGVEEQISVARELVRRDVDKRLLRDIRQVQYGYEISLKSLLSTAVAVQVQDHIPVSRNEQMRVKLERIHPEPQLHSDLNLLAWHIELEPDQPVNIHYVFSVEYPRGISVRGLRE